MEQGIVRELLDREAWALALFAAAVSALIVHDAQVALIAFAGTLAVRCLAGLRLHGTDPPPDVPYPDLSLRETHVAWHVHHHLGNPRIALLMGIRVREVDEAVRRIEKAWGLRSRDEIIQYVANIRRESLVHPGHGKPSREWLVESGWGIGVMAVGVGILALSPDTAVLGGVRTWLGLGLMAAGVIFVAVSTITYLGDKWRVASSRSPGQPGVKNGRP